jgi:TolB-like protein/tetratricopeptide (TPR) repeat protein/tRNA A-37 threonylcarbamoyl transferase component Bud32
MVKLAGYRILGEIGRGGMATVYLAQQLSLHRRVALKILRPQLARDQSLVKRFLREGRIAASLHHRNIVAIHDIGAQRGVAYMALEYLPAGSLVPFAGRLPAGDILRCMRDVAEALFAAHAEGVIHRDVKPGNILRHEDGSFLLSDFGVAWMIDSHTRLTEDGSIATGTPAYMSPERWRGQAVDGRSDIYSLGIVLYELCTGHPPYAGDSWSMGMQHMSQPLPQLPPSHAELQPLLDRMLAKEPEMRFGSGKDVALAVRELEAQGAAARIDTLVASHANHAPSSAGADPHAGGQPAPASASDKGAAPAGGSATGSVIGSAWGRFLREARERRVPQASIGYVALSWVMLQAGDVLFSALGLPDWSLRLMLSVLLLGFPLAMALSWYFNFTTEGIKRELADVTGSAHSEPHLAGVLMLAPCGVGTASTPRVRRLLSDFRCIQREVDETSVAAEFRTAREAVACGLIALREEGARLRAGIALGEVGRDLGRMTGEGMRDVHALVRLAAPGGLAVSHSVHESVISRFHPRLAASMHSADASTGDMGRRPMLASAEMLDSGDPAALEPSSTRDRLPAHGLAFAAFTGSAVFVLGMVALLWLEQVPGQQTPAEGSIVVMPFESHGIAEADRTFAEGLTDEMQDALSAVSGLRVAARSSAIAVADEKLDAMAIGQRLRVAHLLTATVRSADQRLRISVRLARTDDGFDVWSESFDQRSADIFQMQQEIARAVVLRLVGALPDGAATLQTRLQPTSSFTAYEAYLRGRATLNRSSSVARLNEAVDAFRRALEADPGFARAQAGICTAEVRRHEQVREAQALQRATEACLKAAVMDGDSREVSLAMGDLERARGNLDAARGHFSQSLDDVTLRADAYIGLARVEVASGEFALARAFLERAALAAPDHWRVHFAAGNLYFSQGERPAAITSYRSAIALAPDDAVSPWNNLGAVLLSQDDFEGAADAFRRSVAIDPSQSALSNLGLVQFNLGSHRNAADLFERAIALAPGDYRIWGNLADAQSAVDAGSGRLAYVHAAELASAWLQQHPGDSAARAQLAWFQWNLGRQADAWATLEQAEQAGPGDTSVLLSALQMHALAGNSERALVYYHATIEAGVTPRSLAALPALAAIHGIDRPLADANPASAAPTNVVPDAPHRSTHDN